MGYSPRNRKESDMTEHLSHVPAIHETSHGTHLHSAPVLIYVPLVVQCSWVKYIKKKIC